MEIAAKYERSIADASVALENLYHCVNLDIRDTAEGYSLSHDGIVVFLWKAMLRDMFEAGAKRHDIIEIVRMVSAEWRRSA